MAWGINNPISSIEHALVVLGNYPLRRWLALLLFGSARNNAAANALMDLALTRARLMELLGKARLSREECEQLFMLGMFSLIDVIMQVPLERALSPLKLQQPVADALLSGSGPLADYLALAQAVERGDEARLADTSERLGVAAGSSTGCSSRRCYGCRPARAPSPRRPEAAALRPGIAGRPRGCRATAPRPRRRAYRARPGLRRRHRPIRAAAPSR